MVLTLRTPARGLFSVYGPMDRLWNELLWGPRSGEAMRSAGRRMPAVDIYETDGGLVFEAELPGFSKDEVSLELKNHRLTLTAEHKGQAAVEKARYHRVERAYGAFRRSFVLPNSVDTEKAQATFKDGVLRVQLPKLQQAMPKRIAVNA